VTTPRTPTPADVTAHLLTSADRERDAALATARKLHRDLTALITALEHDQQPFTQVDGALGISTDATSIERRVHAWLGYARAANLAHRATPPEHRP
jgi:hypothetical protein